ncbi:sensor histidine kinase [Sphingomonas hankookensis]
MLWLALRQTTGPLRRLTQGVRALGDDLAMPDLRVEGSREVRALAASFNDMKARIAVLVAERTFMLAGIAHDLRTYLTRLRLRAEFIADDDQRARTVRDLDQMGALLDDSLLFAGAAGPGERRACAVDLAALTRTLAGQHPEAGRILLDLHADAVVHADPAALERIFANLVDNALRHAPVATIGLRHEERQVMWTFADDGPGVAPADLPRLGTAFARLDPSRDRRTGGTGLGLAIVRALASGMGGTVAFHSASGEGLTVEIRMIRG